MMVPLLLLLCLPEALSTQATVCFNISNSHMTIKTTLAEISDEPKSYVNCNIGGQPCHFQCTFVEKSWFNGSSDCLEAEVDLSQHSVIIKYKFPNYANCTIFICNEPTLMQMIKSLHCSSSDQSGMMQLQYTRQSCYALFNNDRKIKEAFLTVERAMIHDIMASTELKPGDSINYSLKYLSMNVFHFSEAELAGITASLWKQAPQLLPQYASYIPEIWLPVPALHSIPKEKRIISLISYLYQNSFQFNGEEISSMILRIELLEGQQLVNLETSIKMTFRVDTHIESNDTNLKCHYFNEKDLSWKTDGCKTDSVELDNHSNVTCSCNHATPYAVLLIREPIAGFHWEILSYISYIGCGLSAFFTALSLVIYVFSRHHTKDHSISIHMSLSGALFLLNVTFLLTEWGATVEPPWVCVFIAALMHYSLLCCFTWMALEALHLYLLLIKVFNTYYKHYLVKLSLAGWGIPGVIVAISLGVKDFKQLYGVTTMTMAGTNQTSAICWITDKTFFYSMNLAYFSLTFIFNTGILVAVASSICQMKQVYRGNLKSGAATDGKTWRSPEKLRLSCRSGLTVLGLTCLLGTTWGLAFFSSGYVNYPVLYLFCIFNSTQGFFIFLWICLSAQKQRKKHLEDRMSSSPIKTSEIKTD